MFRLPGGTIALVPLLAQTSQPAGLLDKLHEYAFADYVFSVLGNLLSNAIVAAFIVTGLILLYLQKKFERLSADKDTHVAYAVAQHRRKEQTLTDFTDGIPQNLSMVHEIFLKRSYLRRLAKLKAADREPYNDGRTYKQISMAYERDVRLWLTQCQHFTSLCTQVRSRFDSPPIHATADRLRELFELLVELTPATAAVASVAAQVELVAAREGFGADVGEELAAVRDGLAKAAAADDEHARQFDRVSSNRTARLLATHIDRLFMACVQQMSDELRQLPVAGLKAVSRKDRQDARQDARRQRQVERGMRLDGRASQLASQLTLEGESVHQRKSRSNISGLAWLAASLLTAMGAAGCADYGGSVPIDDDAGMAPGRGMEGGSGRRPAGSVDASVPIDDDAGMQKPAPAPRP